MAQKRRRYSAAFKLKVVLEVLKGEKTAAQLAGELGVHPLVLSTWKKHFLQEGGQIFERPKKSSTLNDQQKEKAELFEQIGRLKMEVEWLKKKMEHLT